jgi:uncharacterized membrane protein
MEREFDDIPEQESTYGKAIVGYEEIKNRKESILNKLIKEKKRLVKDFTTALIATGISVVAMLYTLYISQGLLMTTGVVLFSLFVFFISYKKLKESTIEDDIEKAREELNEVNQTINAVKSKNPA